MNMHISLCTAGGALPDIGQCFACVFSTQIPGPPTERAFFEQIYESNYANAKTGTRIAHQRRALPGEPDRVVPSTVRRTSGNLLLESADIDSKDDLKSLLLVDSALRITALGDTVTIQALTQNGASLLPLLDAALPAGRKHRPANARVLRFPPVSTLLDEDARLCSLSFSMPSVCCRGW
jgi:hypothetical protein